MKKYESILKAGNIDLAANADQAAKISFSQWIDAVKTGGDWDYKNNASLTKAGIDRALLDEFGNFHFGMTAAARGYSLGFTLTGAGAYQSLVQDPLSVRGWFPGTALLPNGVTDLLTTQGGYLFGDNPGDAAAIRNGWRYSNGK